MKTNLEPAFHVQNYTNSKNLSGLGARVHTVPIAAVCLTCLLALSRFSAHGQGLTLDWFTVDGGAATSSGSGYSISGTIGQPDTATMSGGHFTISGGFWSIYAVGSPAIAITRAADGHTVSWPLSASGWVLQHAPDVAGPWITVPPPYPNNGSVFYALVPTASGTMFYRLQLPTAGI